MTDLAELGFRVDTAALAQGNAALDQFAAKATEAAGGLNKLSAAGNEQKTASAAYAQTLNNLGVANDNVAGKVGLARQQFGLINSTMRAAFDTAVYGVTPMQELALVTERLALSAGEEGAGAVFNRLKTTLAAVLTPMNLLIGGAVAAAAAAVLLYESWKNAALQLDDAARSAGIATTAMSGLNQAAAFKGVSDEDFFGAMKKLSLDVNAAQYGLGQMGALLRANGQSAKTFQEAFDKIADLVARAATDAQKQQILMAAGLPSTAEWVRFMGQGAAAIHAAADDASKLGGTMNDKMVAQARAFDESMSKAFRNIKVELQNLVTWDPPLWFKALFLAGQTALNPLTLLFAAMRGINKNVTQMTQEDANDFYNRVPTAPRITVNGNQAPPLTDDQRVKQLQNIQSQISLLGELASADDLVRAKEAELGIQWIQNKIGVGGLHDALMNLIRAQKDMADVNAQAQIGVFDLDRVQKAYAETMQGMIDKKLLDPNNFNQMASAAAYYAKQLDNLQRTAAIAGSRFEQLTALSIDAANPFKQLDTAGTQVASSMGQAFTDIVTGSKSASQAFKDLEKSVITSIANMIAQMLIVAPIAAMLRELLTGFFPGSSGVLPGGSPLGHGGIGSQSVINTSPVPPPLPSALRNFPSAAANSNRPIQVVINEAPNTKTETRSRQQGNVDILEITTKHAFDKLAQGKGNAAMGAAFNAQPATIPR